MRIILSCRSFRQVPDNLKYSFGLCYTPCFFGLSHTGSDTLIGPVLPFVSSFFKANCQVYCGRSPRAMRPSHPLSTHDEKPPCSTTSTLLCFVALDKRDYSDSCRIYALLELGHKVGVVIGNFVWFLLSAARGRLCRCAPNIASCCCHTNIARLGPKS